MITDPLEALKEILELSTYGDFVVNNPKAFDGQEDMIDNLKHCLDEISQLADEVIFSCEL